MCPFSAKLYAYDFVRLSSSRTTIIPRATPVTNVEVFSKIDLYDSHLLVVESASFVSCLLTGWKSRRHRYHSNSHCYHWPRLWSGCNCGGDNFWWSAWGSYWYSKPSLELFLYFPIFPVSCIHFLLAFQNLWINCGLAFCIIFSFHWVIVDDVQ